MANGLAAVGAIAPPIPGVPTQAASQYVPAGFWLRFVAWVFDGTVLGLVVAVVNWLVLLAFGFAVVSFVLRLIDRGFTGAVGGILSFVSILLGWLGAIVATWFIGQLLGWLYFALFESSRARATPGKSLLALWVVDAAGQRISFWRATARYVLKFAAFYPAIVSFVVMSVQLGRSTPGSTSGPAMAFGISVLLAPILFVIFYGMAGWTREKRALHDFVSGCYVVRAKELSAGRQFGVIVGVLVFYLVVQIAVLAKIAVRVEGTNDRKPSEQQRVEAPRATPVVPVESARTEAPVQAAAPADAKEATAADATTAAAVPGSASPPVAATPAAAAQGSPDLCEIARAAGVADLLAGEARGSENREPGTSCTLVAAQSGKAVGSVVVAIAPAREYEKRVRSTREVPESTLQDESGIGDRAFRMSRDNGASLVYFVLRGDKMVVVRLERVPPAYESRVRDVVARLVPMT